MVPPSEPPATHLYRLLFQVGFTMVVSILAGTWAGIRLDAWLGAGGVLTALCIVIGIVVGAVATGYLLYRSIPWKH